jgi:branched-chain amino acid transport system permease protein
METFFQQLVNGLSLGSIYGLIALGYTMVYGILRLINFAHGDVYMVGAYAGYYLSTAMRGGQPSFFKAAVVMLGAMVVCAVLGVVIERFAYRPVRGAPKLTSLRTAASWFSARTPSSSPRSRRTTSWWWAGCA